jgi:hypothetical protein
MQHAQLIRVEILAPRFSLGQPRFECAAERFRTGLIDIHEGVPGFIYGDVVDGAPTASSVP